jgi:hypothetical protein
MSTTYRSLANHQFKSTFIIDSSTDAYWASNVTNWDELTLMSWILQIREVIIIRNLTVVILINSFYQTQFFRLSRICINSDQINTINFDQIEYQIITISFDLIEYLKCQKNSSRKDRFSKHSRDHSHSSDHEQSLSKNVHHHQLSSQTSVIKNFSELYAMNQARSSLISM